VSYAVAMVAEMEVQPKDINCQLTLNHTGMSTAAGDVMPQGKRVPRRGVDVEDVTSLDAKIGQTSTNGLGGLAKFGEREILELAKFEIRPFLLLLDFLALHKLGDFLLLEVGIDNVAVADSVLTSVRAVNVRKDVVDGVDAVYGARSEFPLGYEEVPADPALALLGLRTNLYRTRTKVDHDAPVWKDNWNRGGRGRGSESGSRGVMDGVFK